MWKPASSPSSTPKTTTPEPVKPAVSTSSAPAAEPAPAPAPRSTVNVSSQEQATIGKSLVIKGEVTGSESLYVDGRVEGAVNLPGHRVTVGRNGHVQANIQAKEVVVLGKVKGNVTASDRVDIRNDGSLTGDVVCQRISIEDGAFFKGSIDIGKPGLKEVNSGTKVEPSSETSRSSISA
ncbi:MAG: polymer-forming cytoskeletal protein [Acidobacteriia bacterium]|nr:polymer-forming cytoskeletal protein [Terriglobia bacterium]